MRVTLTDLTIRNLKAPEQGQRMYLDKNCLASASGYHRAERRPSR
jgi:hypothetical protein